MAAAPTIETERLFLRPPGTEDWPFSCPGRRWNTRPNRFSLADELDGDHYEFLGPAADVLEAKHPLAATVLRRSMINFSQEKARSKRYRHAARHLRQCESLACEITDYGQFKTHDAYLARLHAEHDRKTSFWSLLEWAKQSHFTPPLTNWGYLADVLTVRV